LGWLSPILASAPQLQPLNEPAKPRDTTAIKGKTSFFDIIWKKASSENRHAAL
jgi:hypothetical protein